MFYNNLPYGNTDDFNERIAWGDPWTKDSYRLLTRIFMENNSIMTKAYVLMAIKPEENEKVDCGKLKSADELELLLKNNEADDGTSVKQRRIIGQGMNVGHVLMPNLLHPT